MGRDKALLPWNGQVLAVRVADALVGAGAAEVFCVGGAAPGLTALGLDVRPDRCPGEGPLAGLLVALDEAREDIVVMLSCDLIAPSAAVVTSVRGLLDDEPATDVAVPMAGGRRQFLCGAYRRQTLGHWQVAYDGGERSVWRAARGLVVGEVDGIDPAWLRDVDTPGDLPGGAR